MADVQAFLDAFQAMSKRDQDAALFLAVPKGASRREFVFLSQPMRRACFEKLLGISSHRTDRSGAVDMRYGNHQRPSTHHASIDSFAMILYNSIAEHLPDRLLGLKIGILLATPCLG